MRFVRYYLLIIVLILMTLCYVIVQAEECYFDVRIHNNSDKKAFYSFRWVDHPYRSLRSFEQTGGELLAGETIDLINSQRCGTYYIKWTFGDISWIDAFTELEGDATVILRSNRDL